MSTTLKVFIILNLLLALAFTWIQMTLYATRENWKRRWDQDTSELKDEIKQMSSEAAKQSLRAVKAENLIVQLENENNNHQTQIKDLENQVTELKKDVASKELDLSKEKDITAGLREDNRTLSTTLEATRQRNIELNHIAQVARATAHQLNVKLAEVEDDLHNTTTALAAKEEEFNDLTKKNNDNEAKLAIVRKDHPEVYREIFDQTVSPKFLQGVVAAVRTNPQGQQDLVMLTIGKEEGIEEGMEFIVFRANQYIVKVRAERIMSDMVACRVIADTWNSNGVQIQQGDLAQNRL